MGACMYIWGHLYPGAYTWGHISQGLITGELILGGLYPGLLSGSYIRGASIQGA